VIPGLGELVKLGGALVMEIRDFRLEMRELRIELERMRKALEGLNIEIEAKP